MASSARIQQDSGVPRPSAADTALQVEVDQQLRVPYYCEENVWRLAYKRLHAEPQHRYFVVFVSNALKSVPMFHQVACEEEDKACCWDYHVILLCVMQHQQCALVMDLDSRLPFPSPLAEYLAHTFPYVSSSADASSGSSSPFAPMFRVVEASRYLRNFSSDRMHMWNAASQKWNAPPPSYECIRRGPSNLTTRYLDFSQTNHRPRKSDGGDNEFEQSHQQGEEEDGAYGIIVDIRQLATYRFMDNAGW